MTEAFLYRNYLQEVDSRTGEGAIRGVRVNIGHLIKEGGRGGWERKGLIRHVYTRGTYRTDTYVIWMYVLGCMHMDVCTWVYTEPEVARRKVTPDRCICECMHEWFGSYEHTVRIAESIYGTHVYSCRHLKL